MKTRLIAFLCVNYRFAAYLISISIIPGSFEGSPLPGSSGDGAENKVNSEVETLRQKRQSDYEDYIGGIVQIDLMYMSERMRALVCDTDKKIDARTICYLLN